MALACVLTACPGQAKAPPAFDAAAAGVVFGARVVHDADVSCATTAADLRGRGDVANAEKLSAACVAALRPAADSLDVAADLIASGRAATSGDVACAIVRGVRAVLAVRPLLERFGKSLGNSADQFVTYAGPYVELGNAIGCSNV
jgi:hypothetical protein